MYAWNIVMNGSWFCLVSVMVMDGLIFGLRHILISLKYFRSIDHHSVNLKIWTDSNWLCFWILETQFQHWSLIPKNICFFVKGKRLVKLLKDDNTSSTRPCVSMSFMFFVNSTNRLIFSKFIMRKICKKKNQWKNLIFKFTSCITSKLHCWVSNLCLLCQVLKY